MTRVHVVTAKVEGREPIPVALCGSPLRDLYVRTLRGIAKTSSRVCPDCLEIAARQGSLPGPDGTTTQN
jgi:hypothetical protein